MKKLLIIFLFSLTFPSYSFSEWIDIASTETGSSTWYYDFTRLFKNNEFVNYWELIDYTSEER